MVKLFYKIDHTKYRNVMDTIREKFMMHEDIDEEKTFLNLDSEDIIEQITGSYDPAEDVIARIKVVLIDESLRDYFDSVLGDPYRIK